MNETDDELTQFRARVGTTLRGKWSIDSLIGVGGMAAVYAATHKIGRRDAIKILHPEVAISKELRARFEQEALAANQLGHPGMVKIFDIDTTDDGAPFLAMELLDGESLGQRAHRLGDYPERELLEVMRVALEVLEAAHERGIVHRDIKPDNLFVTSSGAVKVLDFGIARMKQGGSNVRTRTGALLGTTPYMPPEQIAGGNVDGRADVFAVGATMFRILAKRRIHEGSSDAELVIKMGTQPAPPIRSIAPGVSVETARIIDTALAFDVGRRYPSARAMGEDIAAVLRGDARPPPSMARDPRLDAMAQAQTVAAMPAPVVPRRSSSKFLILAVVASLVVGTGLTVLFFALRGDDTKTSSRKNDDDDDEEEPRPTSKPARSASAAAVASARPSATSSSPPPLTATVTITAPKPVVEPDKYRLLEKKGGYLFCVDSGLIHAYPVKTEPDGTKVCNGTPEGPIPIDTLKKYDPYHFHWK